MQIVGDCRQHPPYIILVRSSGGFILEKFLGGALFLSFIAFYVTISSFFQILVFLRGGHQSPGCLSPCPPKMVLPKSFSPPKLKLLPRALPQYIQLHILQQPNFSDHASQSRYTQTSIQRTSLSDPFCSLHRNICYIKCNMLGKSSKQELVFVHSLYIKKFTISRLVISRIECIPFDVEGRQIAVIDQTGIFQDVVVVLLCHNSMNQLYIFLGDKCSYCCCFCNQRSINRIEPNLSEHVFESQRKSLECQLNYGINKSKEGDYLYC